MMNPYQTNNYNQPFAPYQYNPMNRYQQEQQFVQPQIAQPNIQIQTGISGKMVSGIEQIAANDVPMDGSAAFFPKQDLSEIYVKGWNADGTIKTIVYKPYTDDKTSQAINNMDSMKKLKIDLSDESTEVFMKKFDEIFNKFEELESKIGKNSTSQRKTSTIKGE